ncbi:hypothetical protein KDL67_00865 [bacterium]|nr:hypothetical protein [bacterium]
MTTRRPFRIRRRAVLAVGPLLLTPVLLVALLGAGEQPKVASPHGPLKADCAQCHGTENWNYVAGRGFDHKTTGYALEGAHAAANCDGCHGDLRFGRVASSCADCHTDVHAGELGFDCAACHTPHDWEPDDGPLALHAARGFPLVGVHARVDCEACHRGAQGESFAGTPSDCFACHAADYQSTTNPDHEQAGMSTDCLNCHSSVAPGWGDSNFDHNAFFALNGAHAALDCAACHKGSFGGEPTTCVGCHQSDYDGTTDPNHAAAGFDTECMRCHNTKAWEPATFDHNATDFPLTGAHATTSCLECHGSGYAGTPTSCYACHQSDFENTNDPDHVASGFETTCEVCHSTTAWEPATFDHAATDFPLTGAHTSTSCTQCHSGGYTGTPTDCYACHQSDYDATNDPDHQAAGFNTQCEACHSTSRWSPSTWDHDTLFPIYTGKHSGKWDSCADCHVQQSDYGVFECIFCHEHNRNDTDSHHPLNDIPDYVYESAACFDCHPRGRAN